MCLRNALMFCSPSFEGLGSNPREDMDVCKCIIPERHGGTLNSRQAASPLVRLVEKKERWKASKLGWNRAKSYCHLYGATANAGVT
ncbi:hypothetical protein TNCV_4158781 [Trichonephila clavipes]|nr:hypothetical protein TNCV_4158781 [Trichonephila clavipes]